MQALLVTGGAGFIGSHLVRRLVKKHAGRYLVVNLDKLTYAGNLSNLSDLAGCENYLFRSGCISDAGLVSALFEEFQFQGVMHLAAETHVDRSIHGPLDFVNTNLVGTTVLLDCAKRAWQSALSEHCFHHVSTDEVYGSLGSSGFFTEHSPYDPRSPYSASKAASDHMVRAYGNTYGLNIKISNCSNNYGPNQHPEKLIPTVISRLLEGRPIPVYGSGLNVRDWLFVEDHVEAIEQIYLNGPSGETFNIGGDCEVANIDLVTMVCHQFDSLRNQAQGTSQQSIEYVTDRPGHDFRYAVSFSKLTECLGWRPTVSLEEGLRRTVAWYLQNQAWLEGASPSLLSRS